MFIIPASPYLPVSFRVRPGTCHYEQFCVGVDFNTPASDMTVTFISKDLIVFIV